METAYLLPLTVLFLALALAALGYRARGRPGHERPRGRAAGERPGRALSPRGGHRRQARGLLPGTRPRRGRPPGSRPGASDSLAAKVLTCVSAAAPARCSGAGRGLTPV